MTLLLTRLWLACCAELSPPTDPDELVERDRGQATTEYALVLLGAAMVALLLVAWATSGGGAGKVGRLLDRVIDTVLSKVQ
jgi:Protein of unknown function (DUF4244)